MHTTAAEARRRCGTSRGVSAADGPAQRLWQTPSMASFNGAAASPPRMATALTQRSLPKRPSTEPRRLRRGWLPPAAGTTQVTTLQRSRGVSAADGPRPVLMRRRPHPPSTEPRRLRRGWNRLHRGLAAWQYPSTEPRRLRRGWRDRRAPGGIPRRPSTEPRRLRRGWPGEARRMATAEVYPSTEPRRLRRGWPGWNSGRVAPFSLQRSRGVSAADGRALPGGVGAVRKPSTEPRRLRRGWP